MNVYEIVTDKIIQCLNKGVAVWRKDWLVIPYSNYCTQKAYKGINQLLLFAQTILNEKDFKSPYWLTWNQIKKLNGSVNKGEKASIIIYYNSKIIEEEVINKKGKKEIQEKEIRFLKYYSVFNYEQTNGIPKIIRNDNRHKKSCEEILNNMTEKPVIKYGVNPAYNFIKDYIKMPSINNFKSSDSYYSTLFHELIHWTGHKSRLDRFTDQSQKFGSEVYSKEELIAELGSSFLCHIAGIKKDIIKDHASYINEWLEALNNDKKMIIRASTQARKGVDLILSLSESKALVKTA
jgi:antirestriction protein ArdC